MTACVPPSPKPTEDIHVSDNDIFVNPDALDLLTDNEPVLHSSVDIAFTATQPVQDNGYEEEFQDLYSEELALYRSTISPVLPNPTAIELDQTQRHKEEIKSRLPERTHNIALRPLKSEIYSHVNVMPSFPGGEDQLMKWLQSNLHYPSKAVENQMEGRVLVRFVVYSDGSIGDAEIKKSVNPVLDKEALRVVEMMPHWIPGKLDEHSVSVWCTLPVIFKLQ